MSTIDN